MNRSLNKLTQIANKPSRLIIGLMSGTSLDGLDIALCEMSNSGADTKIKLLFFETVDYPHQVKTQIRTVFAKDRIEFRQLCLLNPWLAEKHAEWILDCLKKWKINPAEIDLIASHGQTVYHCPKILHGNSLFPDSTLQIGDGDHIAVKTGIITISDFRQKHIAAGGEGAPLALYGDYLIFSKKGENRIMLNMGGIANFTFLPGSLKPEHVFVTDTGPGNTMLDAFAQKHFQVAYDRDSRLALQGHVNTGLLNALKSDDFFKKSFPKTTGPELFNLAYLQQAQAASDTRSVSPYDIMATLTRFSADTITESILQVPEKNYTVYLSGGGAHNPLLIRWIQDKLPQTKMSNTDLLGIPGDAKEAVLFAVLANETIAGEALHFNKEGMPAITMGKISLPW